MTDHRIAAVGIAEARPSTAVLVHGLCVEEYCAAVRVDAAVEGLVAGQSDVIAVYAATRSVTATSIGALR